jgi:hypothetical protein
LTEGFASAGLGGTIDQMPVAPDQPHENEALERLLQQLQTESNDGLSLVTNIRANPICTLEVNEAVPCVTVVWKRYATSTQLRFVHEHILRLLKSRRLQAVLGDDTALPTIHAEDQRGIVEDWFPRAQAAGLKAAASKRPLAYFGKLAVDTVQAVAPAGLKLRSFENIDDAQVWLRSAVTN